MIPKIALVFLALVGCGERRTPSMETGPDPDAALAQRCATDPDCVGDWSPTRQGCGPAERCFEGRCLMPPAITGVANSQTARLVFEGEPERAFQVELARAPFETTRGLMCRRSMRPDWGMLFFMSATRPQRFWMFNTLIPLDMVFLDEDWTVVGVVANTEPLSRQGRGVDTPSRYVLELAAGEAARAGITVGRKARFYPPRAGL